MMSGLGLKMGQSPTLEEGKRGGGDAKEPGFLSIVSCEHECRTDIVYRGLLKRCESGPKRGQTEKRLCQTISKSKGTGAVDATLIAIIPVARPGSWKRGRFNRPQQPKIEKCSKQKASHVNRPHRAVGLP